MDNYPKKLNSNKLPRSNKKEFLDSMNKSTILNLIIKNHNSNEFSNALNADKKLCYRISSRYKTLKNFGKSDEEIRNIILNKGYYIRKFNVQMENRLAEYLEVDDNKFDIIKKIKSGFEFYHLDKYGEKIEFHRNTYYKILSNKKRMNYSLKKCPNYTLYYNNSAEMKKLRKSFSQKYLFLKKEGFEFIYLDEF